MLNGFNKHRPLSTVEYEQQLDYLCQWMEKWNDQVKTMKVFLFAITLAIVTHVAHAQPNDPADITKREWSHLTRTKDGRQLAYGCDRRHTYLDDGKCWAYCGADWTGGEWCYTMRNDGMTKGCKNDLGCYHFVDKCSSACSLKR